MSKNNNYTTGNLLDYEKFWRHYKLIEVDLSKKTELENCYSKQRIKFNERLDEDNEIKNQKKKILNFETWNSVAVV